MQAYGLNRILAVNAIVVVIIGVAWYLSDSIGLRYVILFLGTMNALYALWDVVIDGVIHGKDTGSDASEMARLYNEKKDQVSDPFRSRLIYLRTTRSRSLVSFPSAE